MQQLLNIFSVAEKTTFSPATIANWAYRRAPAPTGFPAPVKAGRQLRYLAAEVDAWILACAAARPGLAQAGAAPARRRPGRPRRIERLGGAE